MTSPVRIGLVGYGFGGQYFHAPLIEGADGCELAGVVVRSPERRALLARSRPGVPAFDSLEEMAVSGVDAVVVTTPLEAHAALVREAVQAGLPVVCDKPFVADATTARSLVAAAGAAGVPLSVYQNRRWDADFLTVASVLRSGALGRVTGFESRIEQPRRPGGVPASGGGVLLDLGSHLVDQALQLFGPVRSVYAEVQAGADGSVERSFLALRHGSGVLTHLVADMAARGPVGPRFRVLGDEAAYVADSDDGQTGPLLAGRTPATEGAGWGVVAEERWGRVHREGSSEAVPAERGSWTEFYARFAAAVRGAGPLPVDAQDAVAALVVLDAARASAAGGEVVALQR